MREAFSNAGKQKLCYFKGDSQDDCLKVRVYGTKRRTRPRCRNFYERAFCALLTLPEAAKSHRRRDRQAQARARGNDKRPHRQRGSQPSTHPHQTCRCGSVSKAAGCALTGSIGRGPICDDQAGWILRGSSEDAVHAKQFGVAVRSLRRRDAASLDMATGPPARGLIRDSSQLQFWLYVGARGRDRCLPECPDLQAFPQRQAAKAAA